MPFRPYGNISGVLPYFYDSIYLNYAIQLIMYNIYDISYWLNGRTCKCVSILYVKTIFLTGIYYRFIND